MYNYIKQLIDYVLAFIFLLIFSPLFLIIGILIKLNSAGPILYKQKRSGQYDKQFYIYKFRSMKIGTPELATDKLLNQERHITGIGNFLRKYSLDELPQLLNIIRGEMSFVGPRPALYNQYELIQARRQLGIDQIKPGLTGYAQVKGRDFISNNEKVNYDKYYYDHISFLLDFKIIIYTVLKVIKKENIKI